MADGPSRRPGRPWSGDGREELAAAIRRLMELTVTSAPPPGVLAGVAAELESAADRLEADVPEEAGVPEGRFAERTVGSDEVATLAAAMPFDVIIGTCNPLAPPIKITFEPPLARGHVTFAPTYEGAPGCVHGAALAGSFDILLTAANVLADGAGPTVELSIRYLRPTLIGVPCEFESWVTEQTDRRTHSRGRLLQDGVVTVEAVGEFARLARSRIDAMHRRPGDADGGTKERTAAGPSGA